MTLLLFVSSFVLLGVCFACRRFDSAMAQPRRRFKFAYWNAHIVKRQDIEAMLSLHDLSMLCITETWLVPDLVFELFGYLNFRLDRRLGRDGGVLILIRNEFAVTDLDLPIPVGDTFDAVALSVCSPLGDMAVVCAYMPANSNAYLSTWRSLLARPSSCTAILLCGDFKAISGLCTEKICRLKFNRLFEESWTESKIGESLVRFQ